MKIVFMGTPDFAVPCLRRLVADGHTVSLAVTRADRPVGRRQVLTPPPVKQEALSHGIPVFQPATLKGEEAYTRLKAEQADLFVVVAYGCILPQRVLDLPRYGCVNIHGSLLPRHRGAAPIQWAVLNGEKVAGVTSMQMDAGVDTGDMLLSASVPVPDTMTSGELYEQLASLGAEVLADTLVALQSGQLHPQKQDDALSDYAPMLTKQLSPLNFEKTAWELHNQVRGLNPWPSATCRLGERQLKIHATLPGESVSAAPGTVVCVNPLTVACGGGTSLILKEVQLEGSKRMAAADFLRGHPLAVGTVLK